MKGGNNSGQHMSTNVRIWKESECIVTYLIVWRKLKCQYMGHTSEVKPVYVQNSEELQESLWK